MNISGRLSRTRAVAQLRTHLSHTGFPRLQMFLMVLAIGLAGFLASAIMLRLGLQVMWLRYGLAVLLAYGAFLGFIWVWILCYQDRLDFGVQDAMDLADLGQDIAGNVVASGDLPAIGEGGSVSEALDLGEWLVLAILLAAVAAALGAAVYLIVIAPTLLAEMLLDGVLCTALYRRLCRVERSHWLETAAWKTAFPLFVVLFFFVLAGAVCQWYAPEAASLGGVWNHRQTLPLPERP